MTWAWRGLRVVTVKMPVEMLVAMDWLVEQGVFSSRSELIREAVRRLLVEYIKAEVTEMDLRFPYAKNAGIRAYTVEVEVGE